MDRRRVGCPFRYASRTGRLWAIGQTHARTGQHFSRIHTATPRLPRCDVRADGNLSRVIVRGRARTRARRTPIRPAANGSCPLGQRSGECHDQRGADQFFESLPPPRRLVPARGEGSSERPLGVIFLWQAKERVVNPIFRFSQLRPLRTERLF
jgi:hypothetical protein